MQSRSPEIAPREAVLDGVRGLAIFLVLCSHFFTFAPQNAVWKTAQAAARAGWIGVDIFFVLSGYLITGILIRSRGQHRYFVNFYARRALRIFPAYYVYLGIVGVMVMLASPGAEVRGVSDWWPSLLLYFNNLAMTQSEAWVDWRGVQHLWSLAIEEQFYWLWPLLIFVTPDRWLCRMCLALIGLSWLAKLWFVTTDAWPFTLYLHTLCRVDELGFGALIAARRFSATRAPGTASLFALAGMMSLVFVWTWRQPSAGGISAAAQWALATTSIAALVAALLYWLLLQPPDSAGKRFLQSRFWTVFGRYSYGLYVCHVLIQIQVEPALLAWLKSQLPGNYAVLACGCALIVLSLAVSAAFFERVEAPILRLKRYFPERGAAGGPDRSLLPRS